MKTLIENMNYEELIEAQNLISEQLENAVRKDASKILKELKTLLGKMKKGDIGLEIIDDATDTDILITPKGIIVEWDELNENIVIHDEDSY